MNAQDVFDTVVTHLYKQGRRSGVRGDCRYRSGRGLACAVGCLIDDEKYSYSLEGRASASREVELALGPLAEHANLLVDLQHVHDYGVDIKRSLREIAEEYDLKYRKTFYPPAPKTWE